MGTLLKNKVVKDPAYTAEVVLSQLGITTISELRNKLELIAYARGAIIQRAPMRSAEARIVISNRRNRPSIITVADDVRDQRRVRFGIAHELGHLELHRYEAEEPCDSASMSDWRDRDASRSLEAEANEFAAAFLMPANLFEPLCGAEDPSMDAVRHLGNQFNVSLMATSRRYVKFCEDPVAVVWSQRRQIRWFSRSEAFDDLGLFPNVGSMVDDASIAGRCFDGEPVPPSPRTVQASAWIGKKRPNDLELKEQCVKMPEYDGILSLLWVDADVDLFDDDEDWDD